MTNKMPKSAYRILLGFVMLTFTVVACNNKKGDDKKDAPPDTASVKPMDTPPPAQDTAAKKDTSVEKPVKTTD